MNNTNANNRDTVNRVSNEAATGKVVSKVETGGDTHRSRWRKIPRKEVQAAVKRIKKAVSKSGAMNVRSRKSQVSDSYYLTGTKKYKNGSTYSFVIRISDHESGPVKRLKHFDWYGQCDIAEFEKTIKNALAAGHAL